MLTIREVAARLKVSVRTVRRQIEARRLVARRFGRCLRIAEADLHRFIQRSTRWSTPLKETED